jgi:hypothetical protein
MQISVVIPTLKRYSSLKKLINDLLSLGDIIEEIIVVDSSDETDYEDLSSTPKLSQIKSTHKNGLYQRFLGSMVAKNTWILFLDNDMELKNSTFFYKLDKLLKIENVAGFAIKFEDKHQNTTLNKVPKSIIKSSGFLSKLKGILTAYPILPTGVYGYCGLRGPQPQKFEQTQWLSGGAFLAKKELIFKGLNFKLMSYFEIKLGMGEDPLIGYMLSLHGKLFSYPELTFIHNDQNDSAYSLNLFEYSRRVIFSRLYLSLERARLSNNLKIKGLIYYHWHTFFRVFGLLLNVLFRKNNTDLMILKGGLKGWALSFNSGFRFSIQDEKYWLQELNIDKEKAGLKSNIY